MMDWKQAGTKAAILLIFPFILFCGCAEGPVRTSIQQSTQQSVIDEYLLTKAGFKPYQANDTTPRTAALIGALPRGQISTFRADGTVYHAYPDKVSHTLYVGTQAEYAKYLSLAQGQKVCQPVQGTNSAGFWNCMDEFQKSGGLPK
ncbi:MAG TPA: hypothetical protein VE082_02845 [Desulfobaccales bacterium]|nr:hypothetical protein [Desulfobaccales bacterium]